MTEPIQIRLAKRARSSHLLTICGAFSGEAPRDIGSGARALREAITRAGRRSGFEGKVGQRSEAEAAGRADRVVVLHGLGSRRDFDATKAENWVRRIGAELRSRGRTSALIVLPEHRSLSVMEGAEPLLRRLALLDYRFNEFRDAGGEAPRIQSLTVAPVEADASIFRRARKSAMAIARGIVTTRDLANTPPNIATPEWMAAQARDLAKQAGMKITVLAPKDLARRGMGGILAVGGGSANPPRLVRLEWGSGRRIVSLVGKGVTFDTGGISIKPASTMDEMKYDKSGACTVLGIARATAELALPIRMRAYLPLAENMPDGEAYRPGDIVTCYNGKTVEIINTDAEGRMILADALTWAAQEKPDYLIDYATLTGACVVALGQTGAGLFCHHDGLAGQLLQAAGEADERLWRLPLWAEFSKHMKGRHADLRNSGSRWGGASTAAAFLANFVEGAERWAHIDIAGPAYIGSSQPSRKGATGYGVGLTTRWLQSL